VTPDASRQALDPTWDRFDDACLLRQERWTEPGDEASEAFEALCAAVRGMRAVSHPLVPAIQVQWAQGEPCCIQTRVELDAAWQPLGATPRTMTLAGAGRVLEQTLDLLAVMADDSRHHGEVEAANLLVHRCGAIAWAPPSARDALRSDTGTATDCSVLARTFLKLLGVPLPSDPFQWNRTCSEFGLQTEWRLLLSRLGLLDGRASVGPRDAHAVVRLVNEALSPYGTVVRMSASDRTISADEFVCLLESRRMLGLSEQRATAIEDFILAEETRWDDLVELASAAGA
jgi:hypothetical protein